MLVAFWKPFSVLTQFNPNENAPDQRTLAAFDLPPTVAPLGRLDHDSEGLLLLSDERDLEARLLHPRAHHPRRYLAQVEGIPTDATLQKLRHGGLLIRAKKQEIRCRPARARLLGAEPDLPPRDPPIRFRAAIPAPWLELELTEGKNRQVRRMTAAIGHPTLRLVRVQVGQLRLADLDLQPGQWTELSATQRARVLPSTPRQIPR